MKANTLGTLSTLGIVLLLQAGCATLQNRPEAKESPVIARELVKTTHSWDGQLLPPYPAGQPEISIRRLRLAPGARLDTHRHLVINAGLLLSGQLTVVTLDGQRLHLKAGDPIVELVNTFHYGINDGTVPAEIVVVYAGVVGTPNTVGEGKEADLPLAR